MSPLEDGKTYYRDNELKPLNWWKNMLGVSSTNTVLSGAHNSGIRPIEGTPRFPNQPNRLLIPVKAFPQIIKGLQKSIRPTDKHIFHPWTQGVNVHESTFAVNPPNGKVLVYTYRGKVKK